MWGLATALLLAGAGSALAQNNTGNLNGNYNAFADNNGNLNGGNSQARERRGGRAPPFLTACCAWAR